MIQYSLNGCPMCSMLKQKLDEKKIEYEMITDQQTIISKGITHVPVLELPDGQMLMAQAALQYIQGGEE